MDAHLIIEKGNQARDMRHLIGERLLHTQDSLLKKLIARYKSGNLTNELLWAGFGEIVGLNDFLVGIEKEVKQGQSALSTEVNHGS